jgi:hypothetical protein
MITITNEESKMILEMLFENPDEDYYHALSAMLGTIPRDVGEFLVEIARGDRNILITLLTMTVAVPLIDPDVSLAEYLEKFVDLLIVAHAVSISKPEVLTELCERNRADRLGDILDYLVGLKNTADELMDVLINDALMNTEPVGNC